MIFLIHGVQRRPMEETKASRSLRVARGNSTSRSLGGARWIDRFLKLKHNALYPSQLLGSLPRILRETSSSICGVPRREYTLSSLSEKIKAALPSTDHKARWREDYGGFSLSENHTFCK
ncbi:hypothetical protein GS511_06695 [Leptospira borgpetersenii]|nr:hypothetical protein [Leptospira borgpetersenii serovar Ballum]OOV41576.1 hypothetical protein B1H38_17715 [Leptospira borgpetersenii serovar Ballum]QHE39899.1 hypothetical protein GS527_06970 [Leptospira borgpetersenii]QHH60435.1 hypothetical protein GS511_06695 [Leptospira borgpetersenii]QHH63811.1 hypothetical protein GS521_07010 [Leptospira borgpetersenii]